MKTLKASFLFSTILLFTFIVVVFAQNTINRSNPQHRLAVEIGLTTPLTVNASTGGHSLRAFWRIPADTNANGESPSAIKLEPKMVGNKVEVTVTVLTGDTSLVMINLRPIRPDGSSRSILNPANAITGSSSTDPSPNSSSKASLA